LPYLGFLRISWYIRRISIKKNINMDLGKEVEILDATSENFKEELEFAIWSTGGSSDYRNDRERPYNGQSWTDEGERGKTEIKGITMRDLRDCLIKAMLVSSASKKYLDETFMDCWDFSECKDEKDRPKPTQFLLDNQNETDYISTKVELGTWRPQDVYKINWEDIDPIAICKNLTCEVEKMMGIFPNVSKLDDVS
jgi:hypothetical protein